MSGIGADHLPTNRTVDPVTVWEQHRNAAIHQRQGNRNPFIDHPDHAHDILPALRAVA